MKIEDLIHADEAALSISGFQYQDSNWLFLKNIPSSTHTESSIESRPPKSAAQRPVELKPISTGASSPDTSFNDNFTRQDSSCRISFNNKRQWKRHMITMHLHLVNYKCDLCLPKAGFGRIISEDLFDKHLLRKHGLNGKAPEAMACRIRSRKDLLLPPQFSCHVDGCGSSYKGFSAWYKWTDHVAEHMRSNGFQGLNFEHPLGDHATINGIPYKLVRTQVHLRYDPPRLPAASST